MKVVLLGPPGAGKGTQAAVMAKEFTVIHVSTGDMLREAVKQGTDAGKTAKEYMDRGELVPDSIVTKIVCERITRKDAANGFLLDGFPRNINQGIELENELKKINLPLDIVLYFKTKESTSIKRLTGRRVCNNCGSNFHIVTMKPKKEGICDACGGVLIQRDDDKVDTIKNRLKVYKEQTKALLKFYKDRKILREIAGDMEVNALFKEIRKLLKKEKLI